jgi:hypothetical protein
MRLTPRFPIPNDSLADHFWAHGYYLTTIENVRFLVLNSSWLHEHRDELERGAITNYTLEKLRKDLQVQSPAEFNVAVCHHHPHVHSELALGGDIMINGQQLLHVLSENGMWFVIHGHKHHPKIELAQGDYQRPIVLACGSFSGRLEGPNATVSRNYFHMVRLEQFGEDAVLRGVVTSWNWVPGLGWQTYGSLHSTFPCRLGFGFEGNPRTLARAVAESMAGHQLKRWKDMVVLQPDLQHLMPRVLGALCDALQTKHNIVITYDEAGLPSELGVKST